MLDWVMRFSRCALADELDDVKSVVEDLRSTAYTREKKTWLLAVLLSERNLKGYSKSKRL